MPLAEPDAFLHTDYAETLAAGGLDIEPLSAVADRQAHFVIFNCQRYIGPFSA